jgi:hypothetical protein
VECRRGKGNGEKGKERETVGYMRRSKLWDDDDQKVLLALTRIMGQKLGNPEYFATKFMINCLIMVVIMTTKCQSIPTDK